MSHGVVDEVVDNRSVVGVSNQGGGAKGNGQWGAVACNTTPHSAKVSQASRGMLPHHFPSKPVVCSFCPSMHLPSSSCPPHYITALHPLSSWPPHYITALHVPYPTPKSHTSSAPILIHLRALSILPPTVIAGIKLLFVGLKHIATNIHGAQNLASCVLDCIERELPEPGVAL